MSKVQVTEAKLPKMFLFFLIFKTKDFLKLYYAGVS